MRFLNDQIPTHDLTYSDVFLVPSHTDLGSRMHVDLTTPDRVGTTIPVTVANMTAVAGRRMAETVARRGGIAVLPQDISAAAVADMTAAVKRAHLILDTPITLGPDDTINTAMDLIHKRSHRAVIVIDGERRPIGVFTEADGVGFDRFTPLHRVMAADPITIPLSDDPHVLFRHLTEHRLHMAPVVDDLGRIQGVITERGALRATIYQPAVDSQGRLMVAAAVGITGDVAAKTEELIAAQVDVIVVDTAHGDQARMIEAVRTVRSVVGDIPVVAGNVVTGEGTGRLVEAGADIVKVGVGPGAMCTTRMMTGVGRPQFSAVLECATEAARMGRHVWADGGIRHPRDVALALAAGASNVMIGTWLAGTYESAADALRDSDGRLYKENYGMASARAVIARTRSETRFDRALKEMFEEGISASKMYLDPRRPSVEDIIDQIVTGVRSSCTYVGAADIAQFSQRAVVGIQTLAGYTEGKPLDTSW